MSTKDKNNEAVIEEDGVMENAATETVNDESQQNEVEDTRTIEELLREEVQTEKEKFLRLFAEFENYKKRTSRERIELFKTASQDLMVAMLPVMDDFDRAMKELNDAKDDVHSQGVTLIHNKMQETLKQRGLSVSETKVGDTFDADLHEAITQIPSPSEDMKGKIIDVIEKGYTLGDKIIRYPKVVIGQ